MSTLSAPGGAVQAEPEASAHAAVGGGSRVTTGAVLHGVGALVGVAAVVVVVRAVLGYGADVTPESRALSQLVSYEIWRTLLGVTVALWIAVGGAAALRLRTLPGGLSRGPLLVSLAAWLAVVAVLVTFIATGDGGPHNPLWHARPKVLGLTAVALVGASPLVVGLWCTRAWLEDMAGELRAAGPGPLPVRRRVEELLVVRGIIDASLRGGALGLTVVVVTTGALRNALLDVDPEMLWPASWLLVYGGIFTVVFAAAFVPAHLRWGVVADALVEQAVPLPDDGVPPDAWHDRRRSMRTVLGRDQPFSTRLGAGLAIAAPLLTSALAAFVPQLAS